MSSSLSKLFQPIKVGRLQLQHRVVLAPMTRLRATPTGVPLTEVVPEYYAQRGSEPGTLLITEGTIITASGHGYPSAPGIWSAEQIAAWKKVTEAVHAKGSFIFLQIAHLGRLANEAFLKTLDPSASVVGPSPIAVPDGAVPRALTVPEIKNIVNDFTQAARNAIEAGFDGVELHGANGFLLEEFTQDKTNIRSDEYGGSIENRARLPLEVVGAVTDAIGEERVAYRISPWSTDGDMGMRDPVPQYTYVISELKHRYPKLAYLHVIEPRTDNPEVAAKDPEHKGNDFARSIWSPKPLISSGGHTRESAIQGADHKGDLIGLGRIFIANPDVVRRFREDLPLNKYNRALFYAPGDTSGQGYIDYPFHG